MDVSTHATEVDVPEENVEDEDGMHFSAAADVGSDEEGIFATAPDSDEE